MSNLTRNGREMLAEIAGRHGVSTEAVEHVLAALQAGQGSLAQFNHPDLGGMGQWSQGGMTMVGDMFNNQLKAKVDAICNDVARLLRDTPDLGVEPAGSFQSQRQGSGHGQSPSSLSVSSGASGNWWPGGLGHAASTGAQNNMRYAWFPGSRRLAIDAGDGTVRVYDTGDHSIGGFSQQQSGDQSLSFSSQHGLIKLSDLSEVDAERRAERNDERGNQNLAPAPSTPTQLSAAARGAQEPAEGSTAESDRQDDSASAVDASHGTPRKTGPAEVTAEEADIFAKLERLAGLHAKGILTDSEYQTKKTELLARI